MSQQAVDHLRRWRDSPLLFVTECIGATPSDQQAMALKGMGGAKRTSIRSGHGCHAAGTIILMADGGCKLVEDVRVGDQRENRHQGEP